MDKADFLFAVILWGLIPAWPDPWWHQQRLPFWVWLGRELEELQQGEREILPFDVYR